MLNFPEIEEKILKFWQEKDIFNQTLKKDSPQGPFTFYEGPPTANGKPGIHHVIGRAFKDLIPRFKTMQGFRVERKAGWDTHGLPVELQVEKALKISGKPEIEKYGIEAFNQECKKSVWQYKKEWEELTARVGFWLDMEHPYVTYDKDYIESLWWIFKEIHQKGLLYQGHKVVPHCPRCGTALSSHEVAQGYKEVTEPSVFVKFKVTEGNEFVKEGDYILSWTTTPWTLPGNVALAVGEDIDYVKIVQGSESFVIADNLKDVIGGEVVEKFEGSGLIGVEYEPLFPNAIPKNVENYQNAFKVYPADFVTTSDGTGVVHTAVMYGEDDYNLGTKVGLPKYHTVDENGKFIIDFIGLKDRFVKNKEVEQIILQHLRDNNLFFKTLDYTHDYPFCWRCGTPLLYYAKDSWFFKVSEIREQLIAENQKINWVPEHIKNGRFGEWLSGIKDWAVSRERYWGTPLPIWQCSACKKIKVIGSYEELAKESKTSAPTEKDFDPHKPYIDEYKLQCVCGQEMRRVKEVADCWFDSGSMPFAQHHYPFENKEKVDAEDYYPADYIAEAIDQTRGWFYTLLSVGTLLGKGAPYQNVICYGHINDANGQKMSKSKGNIVDPWEVINKWGADALRFHLYTVNQPGESKNFDIKNVEEVVKKNFLIIFNVLTFYKTYAQDKLLVTDLPRSNNVLDQWIITKLNQLIITITNCLEHYDIFAAGRSLNGFINDLSTWYLRRSRDRFKGDDIEDKNFAISTLGYVLTNVAKLMAPFTPFVAEELYQQLGGDKSVHLENWPVAVDKVDDKLIDSMEIVRKITELSFAKRDETNIKVRQTLASLTVTGAELPAEFLEIIKDEVNVKEVKCLKGETLSVVLDTVLTPELKAEGLLREIVRTVNQMRKDAGLTINDRIKLYAEVEEASLAFKVFTDFETELKKSTLSSELSVNQKDGEVVYQDFTLNNEAIRLAVVLQP